MKSSTLLKNCFRLWAFGTFQRIDLSIIPKPCLVNYREINLSDNFAVKSPKRTEFFSIYADQFKVKYYLIILLLVISAGCSSIQSQQTCVPQTSSRSPSSAVECTDFFVTNESQDLNGLLQSIGYSASGMRPSVLNEVKLLWSIGYERPDFAKAEPYLAENKRNSYREDLLREFLTLAEILHSKDKILFDDADIWVRTPLHARYLYQRLSQDPDKSFRNKLLKHLYKNNSFFANIVPLKNGEEIEIIQYSFEKETRSERVADLYKIAKFSDEEWLELDVNKRLSLLRKHGNGRKTQEDWGDIAPTVFKSHELGILGNEGSEILEVKHASYEIDQNVLMNQVQQTTELFEETDSVHVHVAFELPKSYGKIVEKTKPLLERLQTVWKTGNDIGMLGTFQELLKQVHQWTSDTIDTRFRHPAFEKMMLWYKQLNDYVYLKGMSEGLFSTNMTKMVPRPGGISWLYHVGGSLRSQFRMKLFSVGLRIGKPYSAPPNPENVKLGLEFRDTTRNLANLRQYIKNASESIAKRIWENGPRKYSEVKSQGGFYLGEISKQTTKSLSPLDLKFTEVFYKSEPMYALPYLDWESHKYYNYQSQAYETVQANLVESIKKARQEYTSCMKDNERQIQDLKNEGKNVMSADWTSAIGVAVKGCLKTWALVSQVFILFSGI